MPVQPLPAQPPLLVDPVQPGTLPPAQPPAAVDPMPPLVDPAETLPPALPSPAPSEVPTVVSSSSTPPPTTPSPGSFLTCKLNCYGDSSTPVDLGGQKGGIECESLEECKELCKKEEACESVVFGDGKCYGKKEVRTSKCQKSDGDYVTEFLKERPMGTCTVMGDPHILTFDNPNGVTEDTTQLAAGVYTLVQSPELAIQGHFGFSHRFPSASSLTGIAVSGGLLGNKRLTVMYLGPEEGPEGFKVHWDNKTILENIGDSFKAENFTAMSGIMDPQQYHPQARHTIGGTEATGDLPSLLFQISPDVRIYVLLGNETMNAVFTMKKLVGGQDGYCGNFDCMAHDDTLVEITARGVHGALPQTESLLSWLPLAPTFQRIPEGGKPAVQTCEEELLAKAQEACKNIAEEGVRQGCIYDVCAAQSTEIAQTDVAAKALAENVMQKWSSWSPLRLFQRIPMPVMVGFAAILFFFQSVRLSRGWALRRGWKYRRVSSTDGEARSSRFRSSRFDPRCAHDEDAEDQEGHALI